ncbi:tRNA (adenosine(37)-N6)-dimethylallyltransferase MiaA [Leptolyngbyaceae cyanobacterium UHCC 1019]
MENLTENNTLVPILIVICGATATGKSGLAIALANRMNGVVLSADSRQVYREFNIGTAKPAIAVQQTVPHYLIDICEPTETLTLAEYQMQAQQVIETIHRGKGNREQGTGNREQVQIPIVPLLVGGTGLYIRSITRGLKIPKVSPQPELRSQLQTLGQHQCYAMLQRVDPAAAAKIHAHDQVRTLRSLEVFYVTGQPMSAQQGEQPPTYPILQIGLECGDRPQLDNRITQRTNQMIAQGFVAEVESLCEKYGADLPLLNTLGYAEFKQFLAGKMSQKDAIAATILHTRQFAKRQRTWFRAYPEIEWFDADAFDLEAQVWQRIQEFLQQNTQNLYKA